MAVRAVLHLPAAVRAGVPFEVRVTVAHAMETGYRSDDAGDRLPRDLIRRFECWVGEELAFSADLFAAVAANPYLSFWLQVERDAVLRFLWRGDQGFEHREQRAVSVA